MSESEAGGRVEGGERLQEEQRYTRKGREGEGDGDGKLKKEKERETKGEGDKGEGGQGEREGETEWIALIGSYQRQTNSQP